MVVLALNRVDGALFIQGVLEAEPNPHMLGKLARFSDPKLLQPLLDDLRKAGLPNQTYPRFVSKGVSRR